jgi:hypothetical protein
MEDLINRLLHRVVGADPEDEVDDGRTRKPCYAPAVCSSSINSGCLERSISM